MVDLAQSEINVVFLLSSHSACVFTADPTLTVEKVTEVMGEVGDWEEMGDLLDVPDSKLHEINQQSSSEKEKHHSLCKYWVNTDPDASWEKLGRALYDNGEKRAAAVAKPYMPKGIHYLFEVLSTL